MSIPMLGAYIAPCDIALAAKLLSGLPEFFITLEFDDTWDGALDATRKGIFQTAANRLGCYLCRRAHAPTSQNFMLNYCMVVVQTSGNGTEHLHCGASVASLASSILSPSMCITRSHTAMGQVPRAKLNFLFPSIIFIRTPPLSGRWEKVVTHIPCAETNPEGATGELIITITQQEIDGAGGQFALGGPSDVYGDCPGVSYLGVM